MRLSVFALAFALLPLAGVHAEDGDISKVNGSVRVAAGQHAGEVSTVNGAIHIDSRAVVDKANTVNGSVELGAQAQAHELHTVNGAISLGEDAQVKQSVQATNGGIKLAHGADVGGPVGTVNGGISLDQAHVGGGLRTVSGDITVGANSHVEGGILVEKNNSWFSNNTSRPPRIVIGPHAVVQGTLEFQREVELHVSDSAQIGAIKGATAIKFSGDQP